MKKRIFLSALAVVLMSGCMAQSDPEEGLTQEEKELNAVSEWFSDSMTDEEEFSDTKEYQYYARTLGLEKDAFLSADMWEVFYSPDININREIDEKAYYLIRLDPKKLMDIYAENNNCTANDICGKMSLTADQLYYNWGYTVSAADYADNHEDNKATYSQLESDIFGQHNGENRQIVMSTHFLVVDISDGNAVTYLSEATELKIRQRDILRSTTKETYNYSAYTTEEKEPAFSVNGIGIRRVLPLSIPNAFADAADSDITVMVNQSPFSYGCTDADKVVFKSESEVSE
ncbi:MAG: hypothetical protein MSH60_04190 [Ruminococcus sp.]|nr:hypothetical protein [Ruminococcus sp.]